MFPNYKTIFGIPLYRDKWEDLGEIRRKWTGNDDSYIIQICDYCHNALRIGREKKVTFKYCPICFRRSKPEIKT